ncbi:hypothetical protein [Cupriavidus sp. H18C1]
MLDLVLDLVLNLVIRFVAIEGMGRFRVFVILAATTMSSGPGTTPRQSA